MAKQVGKMHLHDLPDVATANFLDVYRCGGCNREYYKDGKESGVYEAPKWQPVSGSVEYSVRDSGEPEVGNWTPDMMPTVDAPQLEQTSPENAPEVVEGVPAQAETPANTAAGEAGEASA